MKSIKLLITVTLLALIINCKNGVDPLEEVSFKNGDFERGTTKPDYWEIEVPEVMRWEGANPMTWEWNTKNAYSGQKCLKFYRVPGYTFSLKHSWARQLITDFETGKEISFSAYITIVINEGTAAIAIEFLDEENEILRLIANEKFIDGIGKWEKYTINSKIPSSTKKIYVYCIFDGGGTAYFDKTEVTFN